MWATSVGPYFPAPITKRQLLTRFPINASTNSRQPQAATNGGSSPKQEKGKEISGSDVLWALQRAAAQKRKAKRKKKVSSDSDASHREKDGIGINYSDVRPLEIKSEWSLKLDELEKLLQELEATT